VEQSTERPLAVSTRNISNGAPAGSEVEAFGYKEEVGGFQSHEAEWTPYQTHCYSENLVVPGNEPGTSGFAARNSDH
jgi:hypothetical protein